MNHIINREDFINEMKSNNQYPRLVQPLEKSENIRMLDEDKKVKGFEEFLKLKNYK